jgi:hypothetical protein
MKENRVRQDVAGRLQQARTALDDARFVLEGGRSPQRIVGSGLLAMFYPALAWMETVGRVRTVSTATANASLTGPGRFDIMYFLQ